MKQEKKIDIDMLYEELRDYCLEVLVDNVGSWRGDAGGDERMVRAKFAYLIGVSDAVKYMDNMLRYYSDELGEEDTMDEEND
nr:MAG TPA: hypothetical protein [Caudoviricetes sp.]